MRPLFRTLYRLCIVLLADMWGRTARPCLAFNEDQYRVRKDHAAENFAILRHIVLNMLRRETTTKKGLKVKRRKAGWSKSYLTKILDINDF